MRKPKSLLVAFALLGCSIGAWAQTDMTSSVKTDQSSWAGGGTYGSVTLSTGTTTSLVERYYSSFPCAEIPLKQTLSVDNGIYMATLYAHSNLAWISSDLVDGQSNYAYVYAKSDTTTVKTYIVANRATGISAYKKYDVVIEVTDGSLELGLGLDNTRLSNWNTIQIYQLTKYDSYDQLLAPLKSPLKTALDEANSYYTNSTDNSACTAKSTYKTAIDKAQATYDAADTYEKAVAAKADLESAISDLQAAYQVFALSGAMPTDGHPFDLTFTLTNPTFGNNNADGWTYSKVPGFQTYGNAEYFQTDFDISQTVKNLPQAYYKLKVKAFQRPGGYTDVTTAYVNASDKSDGTANVSAEIYVNSGSQKIKNIASPELTTKLGQGGDESAVTVNGTTYYVPNDMNSADKYFSNGYYENEIELICTTGEAKMGFRCTETGTSYWTIFDDFRLYLTKPVDLSAYQAVYRNAIAEANRTISLNPDVKGKEKADLDTLIAATEPTTIDGLTEATEKIEAAATAYAAANDSWKRYGYASTAATKASVTYTDITSDNTKAADDAKTASNELFVSALTSANTKYNSFTIGFEKDEYAPYNLGTAGSDLSKVMADGAVSADKVAAADGATLLAAVTNVYDCKANEAEVNAIYDGTLKNAPIQATNANVVLPGWNTVSGNLRQTFQGSDSKACLAGADDATGLFVHPGTYQYGNTDGYTIPLKKGYYRASAKYCSWEGTSNTGFELSILKGSDKVATKSFGANSANVSSSDALKKVTMDFEVEEDGNYVLNVYANGNTFMTDFYILKATATDVTLDEEATYSPEAAYANVTLKRTFVEGWNGLVLPFDMTVADAKTKFNASDIKQFSGIEVDDTKGTTLKFEDAESIEASTPVMIKVSSTPSSNEYKIEGVFLNGKAKVPVTYESGDVKYSFTGTYANESLAGQKFTLIQGSKIYNYDGTESTVNAKTFRAYFLNESTEDAASKIYSVELDDTATAITEVKSNANGNADTIYDLQGRIVKTAVKGIYIKNGKKVIVK